MNVKKNVYLTLAASLALCAGLPSFKPSGKVQAEELTCFTIEENQDYYSTTTYYYDKSLYEQEIQRISQEENTVAVASANSQSENIEGDFNVGVIKTVYWEETIQDGLLESRLLTKEELENNEVSAISSMSLGTDSTSRGKLKISLEVLEGVDYHYTAVGEAYWSTNAKWGGSKYPDYQGMDFIAMTWGGSGELKTVSKSMTGKYKNDDSISFSQTLADSYSGYAWEFKEKDGGGLASCMDTATCKIEIGKTYQAVQNKETNVKFTYIHTWSSIYGNLYFEATSDGELAAGVTLTETTGQWQLQLDIAGLKY